MCENWGALVVPPSFCGTKNSSEVGGFLITHIFDLKCPLKLLWEKFSSSRRAFYEEGGEGGRKIGVGEIKIIGGVHKI